MTKILFVCYGDNALLAVIHNGQRKNQIEAIHYLIDNGINLNYQNTINGHTALMEALSDSEIFYLLLNAGADTMLRSKEGKTAYDMAVEQGRLDLVKTLMDYPH